MSIQVVCPNGHVLKVGDELAGQSGHCPVCKAWVKVPDSVEEPLSDDALKAILGAIDPSTFGRRLAGGASSRQSPPRFASSEPSPSESWRAYVRDHPEQAVEEGRAGQSAQPSVSACAGSVPPPMACPHCSQEVGAEIRICPHCHGCIAGSSTS